MLKIIRGASLVFIFLSSASFSLNAQFRNYAKEEFVWRKGEIVDENGEKIKGDINYNFVSDILKMKLSNGEEKIFTSNNVLYFEFVDENNETTKYFSLQYDFSGGGYARYAFYKVEYEGRHDVIVSKNFFEYEERKYSVNGSSGYSGPTTMPDGTSIPGNSNVGPNWTYDRSKEKVSRSVYINSRGNMKLVLTGKVDKLRESFFDAQHNPEKEIEKEIKKIQESKSLNLASEKEVKKYKLMNKDFIKELYPDYYPELKKFSSSNNYKYQSIDDLIEIVEKKCDLEKVD